MLDYGNLMKRLRKEKGETLYTLAEKLNVTPPFLSLLENGKKLIPLDYIEKLTLIFDLNDEESAELKSAIELSNKRIVIDLGKLNDEKKEVSILFSRKINNLENEGLSKIKEILSDEGEN